MKAVRGIAVLENSEERPTVYTHMSILRSAGFRDESMGMINRANRNPTQSALLLQDASY